ncbi:hypothetical protein B0H19DRAFT_1249372 [Mycena capillaripes]|nr:hypothetical protein B0H19DRAFT_1249372 [Mycena capillaripes]
MVAATFSFGGDRLVCIGCDLEDDDARDLYRSVWAGNRFDIVSAEWLTEAGADADEQWTDVTDEVLNEFEGIWLGEYAQYDD